MGEEISTYLILVTGWAIFITLLYVILALKYNKIVEESKRIKPLENEIALKNSLLAMYERRTNIENGTSRKDE